MARRAVDAAASVLRHPGAGAEALAAARRWAEAHSEAEDKFSSLDGPTVKQAGGAPLVEADSWTADEPETGDAEGESGAESSGADLDDVVEPR